MKYDLDLFLELNEEYRSKPLAPTPPQYDPDTLTKRANRRAETINGQVRVKGKRVLEIGCGRGEVCRALNKEYGCEVVGVDVSRYQHWDDEPSGVTFIQTDLTAPNPLDIGKFDLIYSNSVWEHVRHPFTMLQRAYEVLKPGGHLLLSANLYRGPKASHRYREIFFPWPHLLFTDEVIDQFYRHIEMSKGFVEPSGAERPMVRSAWVNQLSIADYFNYFNLTGFEVLNTRYSTTPLDEQFIARFADKLDRIPRYDLERDFLHVKLRKPLPLREQLPLRKPRGKKYLVKLKTFLYSNILAGRRSAKGWPGTEQ